MSTSQQQLRITFAHEDFILHALKAMFWERKQILLLSDLHIGKIGHFRQAGLSIPAFGAKNNLWNLHILFETFDPAEIIVIGDLFHSRVNDEWADFEDFLGQYPLLKKTLVLGNHDQTAKAAISSLAFEITPQLTLDGIQLVHDPADADPTLPAISGHIHPGVRLKGKGQAHLVLPCFHFTENMAVLPAFGTFTGFVPIKLKKEDRIVAVSDNQLFEIATNKSIL
jgi:uncharacterized protein